MTGHDEALLMLLIVIVSLSLALLCALPVIMAGLPADTCTSGRCASHLCLPRIRLQQQVIARVKVEADCRT